MSLSRCTSLRSALTRRSPRFAGLGVQPPRFAITPRSFASKRYNLHEEGRQEKAVQAAQEFREVALPSEGDLLAMIRRLEISRPVLTLPLLVLESMLPGQRLLLDRAFDETLEIFADLGEIGVFGMSYRPPDSPEDRDAHCHLHTHGVVARVQRNATWQQWEIVASHAIQHVGPGGRGLHGVDLVRAQVVEDEAQEADVEAARALAPLVAEWCEEVRRTNVERFEGQLSGALEDLGAMPSPESPGDFAFWVSALVNPLPALGVASEIRPKVLAARSISDRIDIARAGIEGSIRHLASRGVGL